MNDKSLSDEDFKNIYSRVPRLCVDVVIKSDKGILLTLRDVEPYRGLWHIPGGTVLYGETMEEAAKRFARNEIGVDVETLKILGCIEFPSEKLERNGWGWPIAFEMLCVPKSENFVLDNQAKEWRFFKSIKDLPENTIKEQRKFLETILT